MPDWMKDFKNIVNQWLYDLQQANADITIVTKENIDEELGPVVAAWGNEVNQWWYELWISLGWY